MADKNGDIAEGDKNGEKAEPNKYEVEPNNDEQLQAKNPGVKGVKWIDNGEWTPDAYKGPGHLVKDFAAKTRFGNVIHTIYAKKATHKNRSYNENKLARLVVYLSQSPPEFDCLIAAGNKEVMEAIDAYNMSAEEVGQIAFLHAPRDQISCLQFERLLKNLDLSTLRVTAFPEGSYIKSKLPIFSLDGSELLIQLLRPTVQYQLSKAIKFATCAAWFRKQFGTADLYLLSYDSQISAIYSMLAGWAGTTCMAMAKKFNLPHFSLEFTPEVAKDIAKKTKGDAFAKTVEAYIADLDSLMEGEESSPIEDILGRILVEARNPSKSRFIAINTSLDLNGFGGLLLGLLERGAKGTFALMITDDYQRVSEAAMNLFNTMYKRYPVLNLVEVVGMVNTLDDLDYLTPLIPAWLVGESCYLSKANLSKVNESAWNQNLKTVATYDTNLDPLAEVMLQSGDVWRVKNAKGDHIAYHVTSVGQKCQKGTINAYSIDGTDVKLDGASVCQLTHEISMDEFEFHSANTPTVLAQKMEGEERLNNPNAQTTYWLVKKPPV